MTIFGKRLSDYVAFSKVLMIVVLAVGVLRLALSLGGVSNSAARWLSISVAVWLCVLYAAVKVHTSGFGSYKQLLPVVTLLNWVAQGVAVVAIVLAIVTGVDNIYAAPEYGFGGDGKTWTHVGAHLLIGTTVASLIYWLVGCAVLFVARRVASRPARAEVPAA